MKMKNMILTASLLCMLLLVSGCLLVSGTFVIVETIDISMPTGFYSEAINLTNNEDWEEHRDKLDNVELVGFELWITNNGSSDWSFWAYMDEFDGACLTVPCVEASTTKFLVFDTLTVPASTFLTQSKKYVSYAESFTYIKNQDLIKQMIFDGKFQFFAFATGSSGSTVDSIRVIITVNASDT